MQHLDRRDFLGTLSLAGLTGPIIGTSSDSDGSGQDSVIDVRRDVTRSIARYVIATRHDELPAAVRKEARRTLLNWVGCAVGGSRHETLDAAIAALAPFSGPPQASVLGRRERMDILHASLMNGISSHVFDFDDTHLKTVIHPAGPGRVGAAGAGGAPADVGRGLPARDGPRRSRSSAGSATRSIRRTTIAAGTSPARPACSARRRPAAGCSA